MSPAPFLRRKPLADPFAEQVAAPDTQGAAPRVPFARRAAQAAESVGNAGVFDPNSENFFESFLGAGFGTFSAIQGGKRQEAERAREIDIENTEQARESALTKERMALFRAQTKQAMATTKLRGAQATQTETETSLDPLGVFRRGRGVAATEPVDVSRVADRLRQAGRVDLADLLDENPGLFEEDSGMFLDALEEAITPANRRPSPDAEREIRGAISRVEGAEEAAAATIGREQGASDFMVSSQVDEPGEIARRRFQLTRQRNPGFVQDSIVADRAREAIARGERLEDVGVSILQAVRGMDLPPDRPPQDLPTGSPIEARPPGAAADTTTVPPALRDAVRRQDSTRVRQPDTTRAGGVPRRPGQDSVSQAPRGVQPVGQRGEEVAVIGKQIREAVDLGTPLASIVTALNDPRIQPPLSRSEKRAAMRAAGISGREVRELLSTTTSQTNRAGGGGR